MPALDRGLVEDKFRSAPVTVRTVDGEEIRGTLTDLIDVPGMPPGSPEFVLLVRAAYGRGLRQVLSRDVADLIRHGQPW